MHPKNIRYDAAELGPQDKTNSTLNFNENAIKEESKMTE